MKAWQLIGRCIFWLGWLPGNFLLRRGPRTRVLIHHNDKYLVLKGWISNGEWQLAGGGIKRNESAEESAAREVFEETGINIDPKKLQKLGNFIQRAHGLKSEHLVFSYMLETPKNGNKNFEIIDHAWLTEEELKKSKVQPHVIAAIDMLKSKP